MQILRIDSSARHVNSYSRMLADKLTGKLSSVYPSANILGRDIYKDGHFLSEAMVEGMASAGQMKNEQLTFSDQLVEELLKTDILVLAVPVYNFSIPAALKAYIDLVVRAGLTFRFTENGPQGLIKNLQVWIVVTSNGTGFRSEGDFASHYLEYVLRFVGVNDIRFIDGTQLLVKGADAVMRQAEQYIDQLFNDQLLVAS